MKLNIAYIILLTAFCHILRAQENQGIPANIDQLIYSLYDVISGEKGTQRDWNRFVNLFTPDARLIPSRYHQSLSEGAYRVLSPQEYVLSVGKRLDEQGFFEKEIFKKVEVYGSIAHVWSTYESYHSLEDKIPFARGINSMQLIHDGKRWYFLQIYWLGETTENPIPAHYLPVKN